MYKIIWFILLALAAGCNLPAAATPAAPPTPAVPAAPVAAPTIPPTAEMPTDIAPAPTVVQHIAFPSNNAPALTVRGYDAISESTAAEKRAPYGEHYDRNLFERPFDPAMEYYPGLDVRSFSLAADNTWYYVTIELVGWDETIFTHYGVELDLDLDGFGDFLIITGNNLTTEWQAENVRVYEDTNHDTAGLSPTTADSPFTGDGYDTQREDDPDLAWARRAQANGRPQVQIAFKRSLAGNRFMFGVVADAGWVNPFDYDYNDRLPEAQAGSPIIKSPYYPVQGLFMFDNTCRQAYGFEPSGLEARICPPPATPTPERPVCRNPEFYETASECEAAGCAWVQYNSELGPYYVCQQP